MAIRVSGFGADGPIPQRFQRNRSVAPHQDLRRGRVGVVDVRYRQHRRQGLEGEHSLQGLLTPWVYFINNLTVNFALGVNDQQNRQIYN